MLVPKNFIYLIKTGSISLVFDQTFTKCVSNGVDSALKNLCQGRMRMDDVLELIYSCLASNQCTCFLDNIRRVRSIHMASQNTAGLSVHDEFAETVGLPHCHSLSVGTEE